ncbi:hypothetical protein GWI33_005892 [Rhynchophorus ferrugineus]|uniref:Ferritin n=1 Tax=Rhynchophorus ferrugineus TaxID=354439 RepID=A0A834IW88_RHYFE|nr:hypothetical protein GWI33_005892 [Rhynchophorus ferrugineus]
MNVCRCLRLWTWTKELAGEVFKIHLDVDDHTPGHYDAELTHHLEEALDLEKELAGEVFKIHFDADDHTPGHYDAELTHNIEEAFISKHRDIIRSLAGYMKDLGEMLDITDSSLAVYLFGELLQSGKY